MIGRRLWESLRRDLVSPSDGCEHAGDLAPKLIEASENGKAVGLSVFSWIVVIHLELQRSIYGIQINSRLLSIFLTCAF
jgi:hypothetical protein